LEPYKINAITLMTIRQENYENELKNLFESLENATEIERVKTNISMEKVIVDLTEVLFQTGLLRTWAEIDC
jgi:ribosomal protein S8